MSSVSINGFGDDLCINDVRIGDLTPDDHEKIEKEKGGQNYAPLENVVISKVKDSSTLIARKPHPEDVSKYIEEEILDGLCCYSAVNQGQLNQTIVNAVIKHLQEEKLPTVPRSIRHKYMSAFLLAATSITGMDRVIPKVAGVESWELSFKICRRWGYEVKGIPKNKAIVVGATGNFHGRSLAAVSFSDDPDSKENFGPFVPGIELVRYNDIDALKLIWGTEEQGLLFSNEENNDQLPEVDNSPSIDDFGQDSNTLGEIVVGESLNGVIERLGDRDWFAFNLSAGQILQLQVSGYSSNLKTSILFFPQ